VVPVPEPATPGGRRPWAGRRVVLGVTGGIAAYKAVQLARDLTRLGAIVDVVMTRTAVEFVGPITFEALTGRPVHSEIVQLGRALDHIRLAREADVVCVAPATADFLARAAVGRADDLLAAILLATHAPVVVCPAMNDAMWAHPQTARNVAHLAEGLGYRIAGPASGALAYGEGEGPGRLLDPQEILEHVGRALEGPNAVADRKVVVTAGPTRESIDPVRTLSNRSSGRMGFALAAAAWRRGAAVTLISGPTAVSPPPQTRVIRVETAAEMADAVGREIEDADALLMAAAVADFRPVDPASTKIKRADGVPRIELEPAADILATTRSRRPAGMVAVGFALETGDGEDEARRKLETKGLDFIVLNRADEAGAGFESETNHVRIIGRDGRLEDVPLDTKTAIAEVILDRVAARLSGRA
jgi:phosphopantothenoylcysteine decarboxylase / phosphopantothenate---cysteine ligase